MKAKKYDFEEVFSQRSRPNSRKDIQGDASQKKPTEIKCRKGYLRHDCVKGDSLSFVSNAGLLPSFVMNGKTAATLAYLLYGRLRLVLCQMHVLETREVLVEFVLSHDSLVTAALALLQK